MSKNLTLGRYPGRILTAAIGMTQNRSFYVAFHVEADGGEGGATAFAYLTDKAAQRTIEMMKRLKPSWDGDFEHLGDFEDVPVDIVVEAGEYQGKPTLRAQIYPPRVKVEQLEIAALNQRLAALTGFKAKPAATAAGTSAPRLVTTSDAPSIITPTTQFIEIGFNPDDDVPF